jgi:predicted CXXCH cytochrome family protein
MSYDDYRAAPKLGLDRGGASGHPIAGHPLSGTGRSAKEPLSCLTCHQPHSSQLQFLMPAGVKSDLELCARCH